jgi:hypothetical protein
MGYNSNILGIYNAIEAISVTVGSVTPTVYDSDELPDIVDTWGVPLRLLLPVSDLGDGMEGRITYTALQKASRVQWRIRDLCLWEQVGQGIGLRTIMPTLVEYAGKYMDAMTDNRALMDGAHLDNDTKIEPRILEWPDRSGQWFYAVDAVLVVSEFLST